MQPAPKGQASGGAGVPRATPHPLLTTSRNEGQEATPTLVPDRCSFWRLFTQGLAATSTQRLAVHQGLGVGSQPGCPRDSGSQHRLGGF